MNRKQRRQAAKAARESLGARAAVLGLRPALADAAEQREAGRLREAAAVYRRILEAEPEQPEALHWLGVLEHQLGHGETAAVLVARAAQLEPRNAECLFHLGEIRRALGRYAEAVESYRQALALDPRIADIHFGLGTALLELEQAEAAAAALGRAVALAPGDPEIHNNLGNALAELGQTDKAFGHYRTALRLRPDYAEALLNLGTSLSQSERDAEAEESYRAAIVADPRWPEARLQLARLCQRQERYEDAVASLEPALDLAPASASAHGMIGRCLVKLARFDDASTHYREALRLEPESGEAHFNLGVLLQSQGRFDEAAAAHRRALALRPDFAEAHYNLSLIEGEAGGDCKRAELEALLAQPDLPDEARVNAGFALARILQERGELERAFAQYQSANALKARSLAFDGAQHVDYVQRVMAVFDAPFFATHAGWGRHSERPVLIVGMPRSGTTLVEQILASHPAVHGAGELDHLRHMVSALPGRLGGSAGYPDCAEALSRQAARDLADEYLANLDRYSPDALRVTDKMPGNYLRLGLVALLLPEARVIHCRREPLDTCVSCYFQNFAQGLSFTYDLGHLGLVYREYEQLMAHWRRVLPLCVLEVQYEDLVGHQEDISRQIVAFCGLDWDARCLKFHEAARPVRTASFWQVRQPLYSSSIGRWRAFAEHLGPLFESLDPAGPAEP